MQLKSVADEYYPGLIKDIFIGKGNYNQEILPDSVLLEFGTHVSDKEQVLTSTKYMADVITSRSSAASRGIRRRRRRRAAPPQRTRRAAPAPSGAVTPVPGAPQRPPPNQGAQRRLDGAGLDRGDRGPWRVGLRRGLGRRLLRPLGRVKRFSPRSAAASSGKSPRNKRQRALRCFRRARCCFQARRTRSTQAQNAARSGKPPRSSRIFTISGTGERQPLQREEVHLRRRVDVDAQPHRALRVPGNGKDLLVRLDPQARRDRAAQGRSPRRSDSVHSAFRARTRRQARRNASGSP